MRLRYEVYPADGVGDAVARCASRDVTVTVTASPRRGLDATLDLTERLAADGFRVVPHVAARQVADDAQLKDVLGRLEAVDVRDAFVVAGDAEPAGEFAGAPALLSRMHELGHGLRDIGIAGYPEGHPFIDHAGLLAALHAKRPYATYLVTQVCFDPAAVARWVAWLRREGVTLPVYVGIPGPVDGRRLLRISTRIGVGESVRFLRRHAGWLRILPRGYRPDQLLDGVTAQLGEPLAGLHLYTFNEIEQTERWRQRVLAQAILTPE